MAWSKMDGFDVRPVTDHSAMYFASVPLSSRSRVMSSSQRLWPSRFSRAVGSKGVSPMWGYRYEIGPVAKASTGRLLDMATKFESERGEELVLVVGLAAGGEAGEQRIGDHRRRHALVDRRQQGPAALAGVGHT